MRISDWSSDVCSSDLSNVHQRLVGLAVDGAPAGLVAVAIVAADAGPGHCQGGCVHHAGGWLAVLDEGVVPRELAVAVEELLGAVERVAQPEAVAFDHRLLAGRHGGRTRVVLGKSGSRRGTLG